MRRLFRSKHQGSHRKGATAVEFAVSAPIFFLILFGAFELSRANLIRNTCENSAMEGARRGILPGASAEDCLDAAEDILRVVNLNDYEIDVQPSAITDETEFVTVTVEIDLMANALPMSRFIIGSSYRREITLQRERK